MQSLFFAFLCVVVGKWELSIGIWQLSIANWQLSTGNWQLSIGNWQLSIANRQLSSANWQLSVANWQLPLANNEREMNRKGVSRTLFKRKKHAQKDEHVHEMGRRASEMGIFYTKMHSFSRLSSWWRPFLSKPIFLKSLLCICSHFLSWKVYVYAPFRALNFTRPLFS